MPIHVDVQIISGLTRETLWRGLVPTTSYSPKTAKPDAVKAARAKPEYAAAQKPMIRLKGYHEVADPPRAAATTVSPPGAISSSGYDYPAGANAYGGTLTDEEWYLVYG